MIYRSGKLNPSWTSQAFHQAPTIPVLESIALNRGTYFHIVLLSVSYEIPQTREPISSPVAFFLELAVLVTKLLPFQPSQDLHSSIKIEYNTATLPTRS